jgi:phosphoribosylaminoimidazolecarboxamide formyltransferase/IMP cyclohydrolase
MRLDLTRVQSLRYGENPDQPGAFYAESAPPPGSLPQLKQLLGKELSFNNLLDVDAAVSAASAFTDSEPACVIVKHTTPCGVAIAESAVEAYRKALSGDPVSAFGGIVAVNRSVDAELAEELAGTFLEIIVAPSFSDDAVAVLTRKKNLRLIVTPVEPADPGELDFKRVRGGFLVQQRMNMRFPDEHGWKTVTRRQPTPAERDDLRFAWRVSASVKSTPPALLLDRSTVGSLLKLNAFTTQVEGLRQIEVEALDEEMVRQQDDQTRMAVVE